MTSVRSCPGCGEPVPSVTRHACRQCWLLIPIEVRRQLAKEPGDRQAVTTAIHNAQRGAAT